MNTIYPAIPDVTSKNKWNNTTLTITGNNNTKAKGTYLLDKSRTATMTNIILVKWNKYPVLTIAAKKSIPAEDSSGGVTN